MVGLRNDCEFIALGILVTIQPEAILTNGLGSDLFDLDVVGKLNQSLEIETVVFSRFGRASTFNFEVFDKIKNQLRQIHKLIVHASLLHGVQ